MESARARRRRERRDIEVPGLWSLPDGWDWLELGDVCEPSQYGWTTKAGANGELRFLRTTDISSGRLDWETVPFCRDAPTEVERYLVRPGDILISRAGSVGKSFLIEHAERAVFASYLIRYRPKVEPRYVYYWLQTNAYWSQIVDNTAGIAVPNVNASKLDRIPIPFPDRETQRRIVARIDELFSELDDGEEELRRARAELETYRKSLLKAAVTGDLTANWRAANSPQEAGADLLQRILGDRRARWDAKNNGKRFKAPVEPDLADLPDLPGSWTWASFDQLGSVTGGVTKNAKRANLPVILPYLRVANVGIGRLDLGRVEQIGLKVSEVERVLLKAGDLLIVEGNGSIDQIGRSAVWEGTVAPCVHQNHLIKVRFGGRVFAEWAQLWLQSLHGRRELERQASSTSGLHTLSISKVQRLPIPLPPLSELQAALQLVKLDLSGAETAGAEVDLKTASGELRQSILAAAFRGELIQ